MYNKYVKSFKVEITLKTILLTLAVIIGVQVAWMVKDVIFSLVIGFILMSAFNPTVTYLEKFRIPRALSALVIFAMLIGGIRYLVAVILPPIIEETVLLVKNLPGQLQQAEWLQSPLIRSFELEERAREAAPAITNSLFGILSQAFSNVLFILTTLFFGYYLLIEEHAVRRFLLHIVPPPEAGRIELVMDKVERRMRDWLWGQLILMFTIGTLTYIGLTLIDVRFAIPLAVIAGLLEVIPIIGPTVSVVPALLFTAPESTFLGLSVLALYFIVQQIENQILVPLVVRKTVGLNPIVTLLVLILGGRFAGIAGMFLAIPITLFIETVLHELSYLRKPHPSEVQKRERVSPFAGKAR